ncbi:MAG: type II secretion system minor pseudopilin GspH [Gammaproteobacteria bacterium]
MNSSCCKNYPVRSRGFTLIEILVVVFIIGIALGLVVMSINPNRSTLLEEEAKRIATLVSLLAEESIIQSREMAIEFANDGYKFLVLDEQTWKEVEDDLYRARELPDTMTLEVFFEGNNFDFLEIDYEGNPRAYILSSGEMTPFEVVLNDDDEEGRYHIIADITGRVTAELEE